MKKYSGAETITRFRWLDYYKGIMIILVIVGHANFANQKIVAWIESIMPAFFLASGLLLKNNVPKDIKESAVAIWKRFQNIMLPFFAWALIYAALTPENILKIAYGSQKMLGSAGSLTSLWYLNTFFLACVYWELSKVVFKSRFDNTVKIVLMLIAFAISGVLPRIENGYPWNLNISFCAFGFMLLGNVIRPIINAIYYRQKNSGKQGLLISFIFTLATFSSTLFYRINIPEDRISVVMAKGIYGSYPLFLLLGIIGSVFVAALSVFLDLVLKLQKHDLLSFIGINTFTIFAVHKPIVQKLFAKVFSIVKVPAPIALVVTLIGTLIICCAFVPLIDRYMPLLAGKAVKKNKGQ